MDLTQDLSNAAFPTYEGSFEAENIINHPDPTTNPVTKLHNGEMDKVGGPDFQFPPSIFLDDNGDAITNEADRDDKREDYCKEIIKGQNLWETGKIMLDFERFVGRGRSLRKRRRRLPTLYKDHLNY